MTKMTVGTIIVLGSLPTALLANQNYSVSEQMLQRANSEKVVSAASDFRAAASDFATPAESESVSKLAIDRSFSVDQPRLSITAFLNDNRSYAGSDGEASRELQIERTIAGGFSADHAQSSLEELSHSNRSSDLGVWIDSDAKTNQEVGGSPHYISRVPASDQ